MRFEWNKEDLKGGLMVYPEDALEQDGSINLTCLYLLGYVGGGVDRTDKTPSMVLVSMADGLVCQPKTISEMAAHLTEQKFRPATRLRPAKPVNWKECRET